MDSESSDNYDTEPDVATCIEELNKMYRDDYTLICFKPSFDHLGRNRDRSLTKKYINDTLNMLLNEDALNWNKIKEWM